MSTCPLVERIADKVPNAPDVPAVAPAQKSLSYDAAHNTSAYAAMRLPACYAVAARVLRELRLALPHFRPGSMLDFGSGPGTVIWAAHQVIC